MSMPHICTIDHESSRTYLPYNLGATTPVQKFKRWWRSCIMVWRGHPKFSHYYRSDTAYLNERKRHATTKYNYIIHPLSKVSFVIQMMRLIVYPVTFIFFPLTAAFHDQLTNRIDRMCWEVFLGLSLFADIVIRFFVGRKDERFRQVTLSQPVIIRSYVLSPIFLCDLCGIIPIILIPRDPENLLIMNCLCAVRFVKIFRIKSYMSYVHEFMEIFDLSSLTAAANLFLVSAFVINGCSCVYYGTAIFRSKITSPANVDYTAGGEFRTNSSRTFPFYAETSFRTAGMLMNARRDITGKTPFEQKVLCFVYLVTGKIVILVLGVVFISQLMRNAEIITKYREVLGQLNEYMNHKKLPAVTRQRLLAFYDYKYQGRFVKEKIILNLLSDRLRKEINFHNSTKLVKQVEIFASIPTKMLSDVLSNLKIEVFLPNDIIIKAGGSADSLYFISSGTVCVTTASGREVCHLQDGGYFGEAALVLNHKKSISNVTALEICETYRLDSKTFLDCFKNHPDILSKLKTVAEERERQTMQLEKDFQEQLFLKTYVSEKKTSETAIVAPKASKLDKMEVE